MRSLRLDDITLRVVIYILQCFFILDVKRDHDDLFELYGRFRTDCTRTIFQLFRAVRVNYTPPEKQISVLRSLPLSHISVLRFDFRGCIPSFLAQYLRFTREIINLDFSYADPVRSVPKSVSTLLALASTQESYHSLVVMIRHSFVRSLTLSDRAGPWSSHDYAVLPRMESSSLTYLHLHHPSHRHHRIPLDMGQLPFLRTLHVTGWGMTNSFLRSLCSLNSVCELSFRNCEFLSCKVEIVFCMKSLTDLWLNGTDNSFMSSRLENVRSCPSRLRNVHLSGVKQIPQRFLQWLFCCSTLEVVDLTGCSNRGNLRRVIADLCWNVEIWLTKTEEITVEFCSQMREQKGVTLLINN